MTSFRSGIIFNQTWEDFDVDKQILQIEEDDVFLAITSGGCNILNACLLGPNKIISIDSNVAQNHLLRLKIASIRTLHYSEFWDFFGAGSSARYRSLYFEKIRPVLPGSSRVYWDKNISIFGTGLFKVGSLGTFSVLRACVKRLCGKKRLIKFFQFEDLDGQERYYVREIEPRLWRKITSYMPTFTMLAYGVHPRQIARCYKTQKYYLKDLYKERLRHVFTHVPMRENFFWHTILFGRYRNRFECPDYLKEHNFESLKKKIDIIKVIDADLVDFLKTQNESSINKFSVSDVVEFISQDRLLMLWKEIVRTARNESLISCRSFAPSILPPTKLTESLFSYGSDSKILSRVERTASYSDVYKIEVRK